MSSATGVISERQPLLQDESARKKRAALANSWDAFWQRVFLAIGVVFVLFVIRINPTCMTLYPNRGWGCTSGFESGDGFSWDKASCFYRKRCNELTSSGSYSSLRVMYLHGQSALKNFNVREFW